MYFRRKGSFKSTTICNFVYPNEVHYWITQIVHNTYTIKVYISLSNQNTIKKDLYEDIRLLLLAENRMIAMEWFL